MGSCSDWLRALSYQIKQIKQTTTLRPKYPKAENHYPKALRSHYPKAEIFCFGWKFFSRPLHMKELNLLFSTIPNLSIFIWEKS